MPLTARQVIYRALRRIGVTAEGETPTAAQANDALDTLNDMLHGFSADGIACAHTTVALDSTLNFPDEELAFVRDMLCLQLMPEYGTINEIVGAAAAKARIFMQARYKIVPEVPIDRALRPRRWWNPETGSYE